MLVKVCKHGNSLSIRLGAYITQTTHIKRGDWVDVVLLSSGEIRIKPKTTPNMFESVDESAPDRLALAEPEVQW
jgi:antitoxin component of MazEF toxin-antitoxin module